MSLSVLPRQDTFFACIPQDICNMVSELVILTPIFKISTRQLPQTCERVLTGLPNDRVLTRCNDGTLQSVSALDVRSYTALDPLIDALDFDSGRILHVVETGVVDHYDHDGYKLFRTTRDSVKSAAVKAHGIDLDTNTPYVVDAEYAYSYEYNGSAFVYNYHTGCRLFQLKNAYYTGNVVRMGNYFAFGILQWNAGRKFKVHILDMFGNEVYNTEIVCDTRYGTPELSTAPDSTKLYVCTRGSLTLHEITLTSFTYLSRS